MRVQTTKYKLETQEKIETTLALISDIHFSHNYNTKRLEIVKENIKKINPNYICITGDIIDLHDVVYDSNYKDLKEFIIELSKIGKVIISIGNHEYIKMKEKGYTTTENIDWLKQLQTDQIIILDNKIYEEDNISFIGYNPDYEYYYKNSETKIEKYNKQIERIIEKSKNKYKILLIHTPIILLKKDNYKKIKNFNKISLVLSGHTHGGLIPTFIPGNFGIISPTRELFPKRVRGKIKISNTTIIISSGIMKLSRKSKLEFLNNIYASNVVKIYIKQKIIKKKY